MFFVHTEELGLSADGRKEMLPQENYFHLKLGQSSFSMKTDAESRVCVDLVTFTPSNFHASINFVCVRDPIVICSDLFKVGYLLTY